MSINTNRSSPTQINTGSTNYVMDPKLIGTSFKSISIGPSHTMAIKNDGTVYTWGQNNVGQLGDNTTVNKSSPVLLLTGSWLQVHAGLNFSLALRNDYMLYGWGYNQYGQLGSTLAVGQYRSSPVQVNTTSWISISAGLSHTAALKSDYTLWTWGNNSRGQLGTNSYQNNSSPLQVGTSSYNQVDSGDNYTVGLTTNNKLVTFGDNTFGQLGYNPTSELQSWSMIAGRLESTAWAIRNDGLLFGWGFNSVGVLGLNDIIDRSSPVQVGNNSWIFINSNGYPGGVSAIRNDYTLWTWFTNTYGQLGINDRVDRSSPVQVTGSWASVASSNFHKLAIKTDGTLWGWGYNLQGQLGISLTTNRSSPVQISTTSSFTMVEVTTSSSYAITTDGKLFAWGGNSNGELGQNDTISRSSPIQVGTSSWSYVSASRSGSVLAIKKNNKLYGWGTGMGALGIGDILSRSSPVQVHSNDFRTTVNSLSISVPNILNNPNAFGIQSDYSLWGWGARTALLGSNFATTTFTYSWTQISSGDSHSVAIRSDGRMFAWGLNNVGQVGINDTLNRSSPVQIGTSRDEGEFWYTVSAKGSRTVAIRCDNTLWIWGLNSGYVGLNDSINRSSPVQITTAPVTSYTQISAGIDHTLILNNVGQLYTWGNNNAYQLGTNDSIMRSSPVQISGSYTQIAAGNSHSLVIESTGKLYVWGDNTIGQLGTGTNLKYWTNVVTGVSSTVAYGIRSDGLLYSWGTDIAGTFGTNNAAGTVRSSPVQVGTSSWTMVAPGTSHTIAIKSDGTLWGWGLNDYGQLADAIPVSGARSSPVQIGTSSWSMIAAGQRSSGGIDINGRLYIWGVNASGNIGDNTTINRSSVYQIGSSSWTTVGFASVPGTSTTSTFAIDINGSLFTWGSNTSGALGAGITVDRSSPVQVQTSAKYILMSGGNSSMFGVRNDYTLWGWGRNNEGQLGLNDTLNRSNPVQIATPYVFEQVSAQNNTAHALTTGGLMFAWGYNVNGELGDNTVVTRSSPVQIGAVSWELVTTGYNTMFGISKGSSPTVPNLYGWGNTITSGITPTRSSPVQVQSFILNQSVSSPTQLGTSSWSVISAGASYSLGITTDSKLFAWGSNGDGQLSVLNSSTVISLPKSNGMGYIRNNDNTLFLWGFAGSGQLADNQIAVNKSTPFNVTATYGIKFTTFTRVPTNTSPWTMAIDTNSKLWAWGSNVNGTLGNNTTIARSMPIQIGNSSWTNIAVGSNFAIAIKADGTLWGWGAAVGSGAGYLSWSSVSAGASHTLILRSDKQLFGFGSNTVGQLGDSTVVTKSSPTVLHSGSLYNSIAAGVNISAGIRDDNTLWVWGLNSNGALGLNDTINRSSPVQLDTTSWSSVTLAEHALAEKTDGTLYAWGTNAQGQLGDSTTVNRSSPIQVSGSWTSVSAGYSYSTGISSFKLYAWGVNAQGQLGLSDTINRSSPVQVGTSSYTQVSAGSQHVLAIRTDGGLFGWGNALAGQTGVIGSYKTIANINGGGFLAIKSDGSLWAWGSNTNGVSGLNDSLVNRSSPVQIGTSSWAQITTANGGTSAFGITTINTLYAWGVNTTGQLGINDVVTRSSPVQVPGSWTSVIAQSSTTVAIDTTGKLFTWGSNTNYALGNGNATSVHRSSPVQILTGSSFSVIGAAGTNGFAINTDGTLWGWGSNSNGELGQSNTTSRSLPIQIGVGNSWTMITGNNSSIIAIRKDNTLWGWASNTQGQIGLNDTISRSSPVQIGTSSWTFVYAQSAQTAAIRTDGAVFVWGTNANGILGLNDTVTRSSPVQLGSSVDNSFVTVGASNGSLIKSNGDLYLWGVNNTTTGLGFGTASVGRSSPVQLYSSTYPYLSSPVQVGTYSWSQVTAGNSFSAGVRTDSTLYTWGNNNTGQLGLSIVNTVVLDITNLRFSPSQVGTSSWVVVGAGGSQVVAIQNDQPWQNLYVWGAGTLGLLGTSDTLNRSSPVQIASSLLSLQRSSPAQISSTSDWSSIGTTQESAAFAIKNNGTLWGWGRNNEGQLGLGDTVNRSSPTQIGSSSWTFISSNGRYFTAGLTTENTLYVWGQNSLGQLGQNDIVDRSTPTQISGSYTNVSTGNSFILAIKNDGTQFGVGHNAFGQLGDNSTINRSSPVQLATTIAFDSMFTGGDTSYGIKNDTLYAWGGGTSGQLGDGTIVSKSSPIFITSIWYSDFTQSSPVQVASGTSFTNVAAGVATSSAINDSGLLFAWGLNTSGQVGNATTISRSSIVQIGSSSWSIIAAGGAQAYAIQYTTNFLFGMGAGGLVGTQNIISYSSPVQVASATMTSYPSIPIKLTSLLGSSISQVQSDGSAVVVTSTTGLMYAWGNNTGGLLGNQVTVGTVSSPVIVGNNPQQYNLSPTQIDSNNYTQISAGSSHALAIKSDSQLYGWGGYAATLPITSAYSWKKVTAGQDHFIAIRGDSTLWVWGLNSTGQLGTGDTVNRSVPTQIGTNTYSDIACGASFSAAIDTNNTLYLWGQNNTGQLGQGGSDIVSRSSPTQLGSSAVIDPLSYSTYFASNSSINIETNLGTKLNAGLSDLTFECYFNSTLVTGSTKRIITYGDYNGVDYGLAIDTYSNSVRFLILQPNTTAQLTIATASIIGKNNIWFHAAIVRSSGVFYAYLNGVLQGSNNTVTTSEFNNSFGVHIGAGPNYFFGGYITNVRLVIGTAVYTTDFTPSFTPLQNITNTALLTCQNKYAKDNSNNNFTITSTGSPTIGSVESPMIGYSIQLNGSTQYLTVADNVALRFGTGAFTVELWYYGTSAATEYFISRSTSSPLTDGWGINKLSSNVLRVLIGGNAYNTSLNYTINTWQHIALTRDSSNNVRLFLNGTSSGIVVNTSYDLSEVATTFIGAYSASAGSTFTGYISNVRLVKGTALYTSNFAPSAYNLTRVSGTSLLTCQSSTIIDNSSNNFTITNNGSILSPGYIITPTTYNVSSVYFNGSSDYFRCDAALDTFTNISDNFTIEGYVYPLSSLASQYFLGISSITSGSVNQILFGVGNRVFNGAGSGTSFSPSFTVAAWSHFAVSYDGTTTRFFNNGQIVYSSTSTPIRSLTDCVFLLGTRSTTADAGSLANWFNGYISNVRVVKQALYTSAFTPSTIPLSSVTNTQLLTLQNPIIVDNSGNNNTITVGTALTTTIQYSAFPTYKSSSSGYLNVVAGLSHVMALGTDNTLYTWGGNTNGQLGSNNITTYYAPNQITPTVSYVNISAGGNHSAAIDTNFFLYTWGLGASGQLGQGVTIARSSPTQLGTGMYEKVVASGLASQPIDITFMIGTDGTLYTTGFGRASGTNTTINRSSPVQVGTSYWQDISMGSVSLTSPQAKKIDGTVWGWGYNDYGELGTGDVIYRSSPVQLGASSLFNYGTLGSNTGNPSGTPGYVMASIDAAGQLYTAGGDISGYGTLGDSGRTNNIRYSYVQIGTYYPTSPIQVATDSWTQVSAGTNVTLGLKTNNVLYAWGINTSFQTGVGTGGKFVNSPTAIGATISSGSAGGTAGGYVKNI